MRIARPLLILASALVVGGLCGAAFARGRKQATRMKLDTEFGDGGVATFHSLGSPRLDAFSFAAADAQHLYVAGNRPTAAVARFDLRGWPDETFGSGGVAEVPLAGDLRGFCAVGGLVLCGRFVDSDAGGAEVLVGAVRLLPDGSGLDAAFGADGMLLLGAATGDPALTGLGHIARDPRDGSYVAHAPRRIGSGFRAGLIRFSKDGVVDPTFGGDGYAEIDWTIAADDPSLGLSALRGMAVDSAGRTIVSMVTGAVRFLADGTPDASFGLGDADGNRLALFRVAFDDTGRILGYGARERDGLLQGPAALYRWSDDGELDRTFGSAGEPGRVSLRARRSAVWRIAGSIAGVRSAETGSAPGDRVVLAGAAWFPVHHNDSQRIHEGWFVAILGEGDVSNSSTYTYRYPRPAREQNNENTFAVAVPDGVIIVGTDSIVASGGRFETPFLAKLTFDR